MATTSYSHFFSLRRKFAERYPLIWDVPIREQPLDYLQALYRKQYPGGRVLDFGCGSAKPLQRILGLSADHYHSCDSDPNGDFTYASIDEIRGEPAYDVVTANQVIEHLRFEDAVECVGKLASCVKPGGILQLGVPNPHHPTRQRNDPTHLTAWTYVNLCALVALAGLDVVLCARCRRVSGIRWWKRPIIRWVAQEFAMDWCDTIYVVGKRGGGE